MVGNHAPGLLQRRAGRGSRLVDGVGMVMKFSIVLAPWSSCNERQTVKYIKPRIVPAAEQRVSVVGRRRMVIQEFQPFPSCYGDSLLSWGAC